MNWRVGLALIFFLVLLFAILHMAAYVIPSKHTPGYTIQDASGNQGQGQGQGQGPEAIGQLSTTPIPNHWSTMQTGEEVRVYPNGMQFDKSGNVLYPYTNAEYS